MGYMFNPFTGTLDVSGTTSGGGGGTGDMLSSTYDPQTIAADAFDQDNMTDGTTNKNYTATEQTKLAGIEASATADQTASEILTAIKTVDGTGSGLDADMVDGNHAAAFATSSQGTKADSAVQPGDNVSDLTNDAGYLTSDAVTSVNSHTGVVVLDPDDLDDTSTTNKFTTSAAITKLAGIATGATANSSDATLLNRANHTGTQTASTISDFSTAADARITAATGVSVQAHDTDLDTIAGLTATTDNFLVANSSAWASRTPTQARTHMGLGSIATQAASSVAITGGSITGITDLAVADGGTGASTLTGIVKGNGTSAFTAAVAGTDYVSSSTVVKISQGTSAPGSPSTGDLWVDTN